MARAKKAPAAAPNEAPNAEAKRGNAKFDKSKPYGTIHGVMEDYPTAAFDQDGHLFDIQGNQLDSDSVHVAVVELVATPATVDETDPYAIDEEAIARMADA